MNHSEYTHNVLMTESNDFNAIRSRMQPEQSIRLLHAVMGLATESGELMDALKKHFFYGKPLDFVNLKEEFGDKEWYTALGLDALMSGYEEIWETNINKLRARYKDLSGNPNKFTEDAAINRDLVKEREVLEAGDYLGCDCYPGCWADHSESWPRFGNSKTTHAQEKLPYGSYVIMDDHIRVHPKAAAMFNR